MPKWTLVLTGLLLLVASLPVRDRGSTSAQTVGSLQFTITCRVMEVFVAERLGAQAIIFHPRDKADGPRLGELLKMHSGTEVEFETPDGRRHGATLVRMKSCFGRGLMLFRAGEAKLAEKDEFVLRFPGKS